MQGLFCSAEKKHTSTATLKKISIRRKTASPPQSTGDSTPWEIYKNCGIYALISRYKHISRSRGNVLGEGESKQINALDMLGTRRSSDNVSANLERKKHHFNPYKFANSCTICQKMIWTIAFKCGLVSRECFYSQLCSQMKLTYGEENWLKKYATHPIKIQKDDREQGADAVRVWCSLWKERVLAPTFFEWTVNSENCL